MSDCTAAADACTAFPISTSPLMSKAPAFAQDRRKRPASASVGVSRPFTRLIPFRCLWGVPTAYTRGGEQGGCGGSPRGGGGGAVAAMSWRRPRGGGVEAALCSPRRGVGGVEAAMSSPRGGVGGSSGGVWDEHAHHEGGHLRLTLARRPPPFPPLWEFLIGGGEAPVLRGGRLYSADQGRVQRGGRGGGRSPGQTDPLPERGGGLTRVASVLTCQGRPKPTGGRAHVVGSGGKLWGCGGDKPRGAAPPSPWAGTQGIPLDVVGVVVVVAGGDVATASSVRGNAVPESSRPPLQGRAAPHPQRRDPPRAALDGWGGGPAGGPPPDATPPEAASWAARGGSRRGGCTQKLLT